MNSLRNLIVSDDNCRCLDFWTRVKALDDTWFPGRGCFHHVREGSADGKKLRIMEWGDCDFMSQCVQAYRNACGEPDMRMNNIETPFIARREFSHVPINCVNTTIHCYTRGTTNEYDNDRLVLR